MNETKYADPRAAAAAQAALSANRAYLEGLGLTLGQATGLAAVLATGYSSSGGVDGARAYYAEITAEWTYPQGAADVMAEAMEALAWQMIGPNGSDAQREASKALAWA